MEPKTPEVPLQRDMTITDALKCSQVNQRACGAHVALSTYDHKVSPVKLKGERGKNMMHRGNEGSYRGAPCTSYP